MGAVRILKGKDVPPDDNTLVQLNLTNGTTLNIVIEPEKQITIQVDQGVQRSTFTYKFSNSASVQEVRKSGKA